MKRLVATIFAATLTLPSAAFAGDSLQAKGPQNEQSQQRTDSERNESRSNKNKENTNTSSRNKSEESRSNNKQSNTNASSNSRSDKSSTNSRSSSSSNQASHSMKVGQRFSRSKAPHYRRVSHKEHSKLSSPPRGYVWVRAGKDALLVRLYNNKVKRIVGSIF